MATDGCAFPAVTTAEEIRERCWAGKSHPEAEAAIIRLWPRVVADDPVAYTAMYCLERSPDIQRCRVLVEGGDEAFVTISDGDGRELVTERLSTSEAPAYADRLRDQLAKLGILVLS